MTEPFPPLPWTNPQPPNGAVKTTANAAPRSFAAALAADGNCLQSIRALKKSFAQPEGASFGKSIYL